MRFAGGNRVPVRIHAVGPGGDAEMAPHLRVGPGQGRRFGDVEAIGALACSAQSPR